MKKDNLSAALSALDEDFDRIEGYDVVPDGIYWTVVEDVALDVAQPAGSPRIIWRLRILGPDNFGRQLRRTFVITKEAVRWLKRDPYLCGVALESLQYLPGLLENLLTLKLKVRKQAKSVPILDVGSPVSAQGHLFLHLIDEKGQEYLDQQLPPWQHPQDQQDFEALIDNFVNRYQCPRPYRAFIEDARTGAVLFSPLINHTHKNELCGLQSCAWTFSSPQAQPEPHTDDFGGGEYSGASLCLKITQNRSHDV